MMFKKHSKDEQKHDIRVEVVVHQDTNKKAVKEATAEIDQLNKVLEENHFHLKVFKATGGTVKRKHA